MAGDPFSTLGLEPRFAVSRSDLDARHRELSRALHPDRYANAPAGERRQALSEAINVNQAHRELKDPVKRASVVLGRAVRQLGRSTPAPEESTVQMPPDFLMEMMDLRESLSTARRNEGLAAARALAEQVGDRERNVLAALGKVLDEGVIRLALDAAQPGENAVAAESHPATSTSLGNTSSSTPLLEPTAFDAAIKSAEKLIGELRYLRRFLDEVDAIEDELD